MGCEEHNADYDGVVNEVGSEVCLGVQVYRRSLVICHQVKPGEIFIPMHYDVTNRLTCPQFDKYSRQPSYKACAVTITKV